MDRDKDADRWEGPGSSHQNRQATICRPAARYRAAEEREMCTRAIRQRRVRHSRGPARRSAMNATIDIRSLGPSSDEALWARRLGPD